MNDESNAEQQSPLASRVIRLSLVFMAIALLVCGTAWALGGPEAAIVGVVSAIACGLGAVLAHICSELPRGDVFIMIRLILSSIVRAGIPLLVLVIAKLQFPEQFNQGMVYFVVLFYVVGLLTDIKLQIRRFNPVTAGSQKMLSTPAGGDS